MSRKVKDEPKIRYYFVDEAGDSTLFDKRGKVIVGTEGCSRFFMLGLVDLPDAVRLQMQLDALRAELLADPYFKKIPSMQAKNYKTAVTFHAKDDLPEIRREVYKIIMAQAGLRFFAVVRDKLSVLAEVRQSAKRYKPDDLYDKTVSRLFKSRLHKDNEYFITFARRGSKNRTNALQAALEKARHRAKQSWNVSSAAPIHVEAQSSANSAGLQSADYLLWALQRLYEKREDRYIDYVWAACSMVHDVDDNRTEKYGEYYNKKKPIGPGVIKPL